MNPEGSNLNLTAREFHPQQVEEEKYSNISQVPSVEVDVDVNLPADPLSVDDVDRPTFGYLTGRDKLSCGKK